jgi:siroheme synthase (precorrin-2 oxidase/ferrochelatase)
MTDRPHLRAFATISHRNGTTLVEEFNALMWEWSFYFADAFKISHLDARAVLAWCSGDPTLAERVIKLAAQRQILLSMAFEEEFKNSERPDERVRLKLLRRPSAPPPVES